MQTKELKIGAIFSYLLILANTLYGIFFTPFLISTLGESQFGVYKIIASLTTSITVLDLGIGSTVLRYIAKFKSKNDKIGVENFAAMGMIEAGFLSALMVVVSIGIYFSLDTIYGESLTTAELNQAKYLFFLFVILLVINTFEKVVFSVVAGCNYYGFANALKLFRIIIKVVLAYFLILRFANPAVLMYIEIGTSATVIILELLFIRIKDGIRLKLDKWDNMLFKSSGKYTILVFIQSMAVQFNGNLDTAVIGAIESTAIVTVYSIGLMLYNMYEQFACAFSDLMLPTVTQKISDGATNTDLEDLVIKVGRLEFMALGGALCGFIIVGKEFLNLWLGSGYDLAYCVALILMIPTTIPLIQNVSLSILRAKNKIGFRTAAVSVMAVFNLIFTIVGVKLYGPIAAAVGTAIGLIGANIIAMNIYYVKVIKLNIFRIFKGVFSKIWICLLISSGALLACSFFKSTSWALFIIKVAVFCIVYAISLLAFGMNKTDRRIIFGFIYKLRAKHED